ncbi:hypothetical protein HQ560_17475 [bacterium]|nr:hypothetical protein [bacterium]
MPDPAGPASRPWWETASIFAAIVALWPAYILNWPHPAWRWLSYLMFAVMALVAVRRMSALRRVADQAVKREAEKQDGSPPVRLPWEQD